MLASAQEDLIDTTVRNIFLDSNQNNVNLKEIHDSLFREAVNGDVVNCIINGGILIGSNNTGDPAFNVGGTWNSGVTVTVTNNGRIQGAGGAGGDAPKGSASVGLVGGPAFYTRQAITLTNNAEIWGGGGGGGATFSGFAYGRRRRFWHDRRRRRRSEWRHKHLQWRQWQHLGRRFRRQ